MAGKIYITGDCHNQFNKFSKENFPVQTNLDKDDYVIICGDFGGIWYNAETKEEKWWMDWLDERSYTTLFVDGNHENFDRLNKYPVSEWHGGHVHTIRSSILHLMRGQIFNINGKSIFTFGGGSSHDISGGILEKTDALFNRKKRLLDEDGISYRINHVSWWKEEIPSKNEMLTGLDSLNKNGNRVDYIVTHCAPSSVQDYLTRCFYKPDELNKYLEGIKNTIDYKMWYFGHYHENKNINTSEILLYDKIIELGNCIIER